MYAVKITTDYGNTCTFAIFPYLHYAQKCREDLIANHDFYPDDVYTQSI